MPSQTAHPVSPVDLNESKSTVISDNRIIEMPVEMKKITKVMAVFEAASSDLTTQCKMITSLESLEFF